MDRSHVILISYEADIPPQKQKEGQGKNIQLGERHSLTFNQSWNCKRQQSFGSFAHFVNSWSESSCFRCLDSSFFSMERRTQALALPTSVLISLMFWMCLQIKGQIERFRGGLELTHKHRRKDQDLVYIMRKLKDSSETMQEWVKVREEAPRIHYLSVSPQYFHINQVLFFPILFSSVSHFVSKWSHHGVRDTFTHRNTRTCYINLSSINLSTILMFISMNK